MSQEYVRIVTRNIRTETGTVAPQLLSGDKDKLRIDSLEAAE